MDHYQFILNTDKKSLFNQIKFLVTCGQESFQNDLTSRRKRLKKMLDDDEKNYEGECVSKIKSRVDENIQERQKSLLAIKQKRTKETEKFVAAKKVHQNMTNCLEIREELRKKDYRETQLTQLEQMDDKLRAIVREKKDDEFWLKVQNKLAAEYDEKQRNEERLKKSLTLNQMKILDSQLAEHRRVIEEDREHVKEERRALVESLKAVSVAEERKIKAAKRARSIAYKKDLSTICEQKKQLAQEAETYEEVFHDETMRQVKLAIEKARYKDPNVRLAVLDYLTYLKNFRKIESDQEREIEERREQLANRFYCYKIVPKTTMALKKRKDAEAVYKVVLKQMCEEQARRIQLEAKQRENRMPENRFARLMVRDVIGERERFKKGLDMQLEELGRLRAEEQKIFEREMNRADQDKIFCEELLKRHQADGCDYLAPHPNWKLMACFKPTCAVKQFAGAGDM